MKAVLNASKLGIHNISASVKILSTVITDGYVVSSRTKNCSMGIGFYFSPNFAITFENSYYFAYFFSLKSNHCQCISAVIFLRLSSTYVFRNDRSASTLEHACQDVNCIYTICSLLHPYHKFALFLY